MVALQAPMPASADPTEVHVYVRVEGWSQRIWSGWVTLPANFTLNASSGASHTLNGSTPLAALWAAAQEGGFSLGVSDAFEDFVVQAIAGQVHWDTRWWNYRVDWVQTDYGAHAQWLGWGAPAHPIVDGAEVLWFVQTPVSLPLRMTDAGPALGGAGACSRAELVETLAADVRHDAEQPWPSVTWAPAPAALLKPGNTPVLAGFGTATVAGSGWVWAEEPSASSPMHFVRSDRSWLECGPLGP
jgi:hypothetical protein